MGISTNQHFFAGYLRLAMSSHLAKELEHNYSNHPFFGCFMALFYPHYWEDIGNEHLTYPHNLVGGLEHEFDDFAYVGNVIIPTDELIFFRGVGQPLTSYSNPQRSKHESSPIQRGIWFIYFFGDDYILIIM